LLTLNDLPAGWIVVPQGAAEASDPTRGAFLCGAGDQVAGALQQSTIHFHDSARGSILYHTVATYAPGAATQGLDKIAEGLKTCTTWKAETGGVSGTFSVSPVRLPERGDQTVAFRLITMNDNGMELGMMNIIMTRYRDAISTISLFSAGSERLDKDTDSYATIADQRLAQVLGIPPTKYVVGNTVKLTDGSSVTVHSLNTNVSGPAFQGKKAAVIDAEVCAGPKPVEGTSQYNFSVELADQSMGEQIGSVEGYQALPSGDLAAGQCARGTVATALPNDKQPQAVVYTIPNPDQTGIPDQIRWEIS
jgi:hypothetical protein